MVTHYRGMKVFIDPNIEVESLKEPMPQSLYAPYSIFIGPSSILPPAIDLDEVLWWEGNG